MRKFTLLCSALLIGAASLHAQSVATFDDLPLATADTYYVNYSAPEADAGFNDGLAHFPYYYDTAFGSWSGFAYSNMTDTADGTYLNQYAAKPGMGDSSAKYVVSYAYGPTIMSLLDSARGKKVYGFYISNSTYAANVMRDGSDYSKVFGGPTGNDSDWFKITIQGFRDGALTTESVDFYLADYRFAHNDSDYIVKDWRWVNLLPLGNVDSLQFTLSSSDTGSFGMNTPAYFCMDNFTTDESALGVSTAKTFVAKVYPNPATDALYVETTDNSVQKATVTDMTGKVIATYNITGNKTMINTGAYAAGVYILQLSGNGKTATVRFTKQ